MTLGHEHMSTEGTICYEQLRVMVDMNDSRSSTEGFICYEQLRAMVDMNDFVS